MSDALKASIQKDIQDAMRAKDTFRLGTLRLLAAAIKQREVDERITLDDAAVMAVLNKMIKQRRESIAQYQAGQRNDLAQKEQQEIDLLQTYLPAQLSAAEIENAVRAAITTTHASSVKDMGKVMAVLKDQLAGKADMTVVSQMVKSLLA